MNAGDKESPGRSRGPTLRFSIPRRCECEPAEATAWLDDVAGDALRTGESELLAWAVDHYVRVMGRAR